MNRKMLKNMEWSLVVCSIVLLCIGMIALYSATHDSQNEEFNKQLLWAGISIPVMIVIIFIDLLQLAPQMLLICSLILIVILHYLLLM